MYIGGLEKAAEEAAMSTASSVAEEAFDADGIDLTDMEEDTFLCTTLEPEDLVRGTPAENPSPARGASSGNLPGGRDPYTPTSPCPETLEYPEEEWLTRMVLMERPFTEDDEPGATRIQLFSNRGQQRSPLNERSLLRDDLRRVFHAEMLIHPCFL